MQRKTNFLPFFITFFGLSLVLILLGSSGMFDNITSLINSGGQSGKNAVYVLSLRGLQNKEIKKLTTDNLSLKKQLADEKNIINENIALKSQFEASNEESSDLLPAKIIGSPGFIPGVSLPEYLIINKGQNSGVEAGDAILSNNYLVGKVIKLYSNFSKIELVTNKDSSFTAKVSEKDETSGIVKGQGEGELVLDNVLLTADLKKDDFIITKGDRDEKGEGYPPDILVGKIISIEKNQSDLFQRALIDSPIDVKNLELVFVMK